MNRIGLPTKTTDISDRPFVEPPVTHVSARPVSVITKMGEIVTETMLFGDIVRECTETAVTLEELMSSGNDIIITSAIAKSEEIVLRLRSDRTLKMRYGDGQVGFESILRPVCSIARFSPELDPFPA